MRKSEINSRKMPYYIPKAKPIAAVPGAKKDFTTVKPAVDTKIPAKFLQTVHRSVTVGVSAKFKPPKWDSSVEIDRINEDITPLPGKKQTLESLRKPFRARPAPNFKVDQPTASALPSQQEKQTVKEVDQKPESIQTEPSDEVRVVEKPPKIEHPPADPLVRIPIRIEIRVRNNTVTGLPAISSLVVKCSSPVQQVAKLPTTIKPPPAVLKSRIPIRIPLDAVRRRPATETSACKSKIPVHIGRGLRK